MDILIRFMYSVVMVEGDPHPGATRGRMSFQSFNPSIDVSCGMLFNFHGYFVLLPSHVNGFVFIETE